MSIMSFATNVTNKYDSWAHFEDRQFFLHRLELMKVFSHDFLRQLLSFSIFQVTNTCIKIFF